MHSKENHKIKFKKKEKTMYGMGENSCKGCNQQRLNLQNIQAVHTTQEEQQQNNNPIEKWADMQTVTFRMDNK